MQGLSITREEIDHAIHHSKTYAEVAKRLGRYPGHYFINQLKRWIGEYGIDDSHLSVRVSDRRWTRNSVSAAVNNSRSYTDALIALGVKHRSGNFSTLKRKISEYGLSVSHFNQAYSTAAKKKLNGSNTKIPLSEILDGKHPTFSTGHLRKRLVVEGIKSEVCERCGIASWNNEPITIELDHINGISNDHRLCNLRMLCPNCHSQTPSYKGRNIRRVN